MFNCGLSSPLPTLRPGLQAALRRQRQRCAPRAKSSTQQWATALRCWMPSCSAKQSLGGGRCRPCWRRSLPAACDARQRLLGARDTRAVQSCALMEGWPVGSGSERWKKDAAATEGESGRRGVRGSGHRKQEGRVCPAQRHAGAAVLLSQHVASGTPLTRRTATLRGDAMTQGGSKAAESRRQPH